MKFKSKNQQISHNILTSKSAYRIQFLFMREKKLRQGKDDSTQELERLQKYFTVVSDRKRVMKKIHPISRAV